MKLLNTPEIKFPQDFEIYDPKVENQFETSSNGVTGTKTIEYLAIPRHAGSFTIPSVEFTYFDLKSNSYKTLKTQAYELKVAKGQGNADQVIADFTNKESVKVLGKDIRFIKLGDTSLTRKGDFFFGTISYWMWYLIPFVLFVAFVIVCITSSGKNVSSPRSTALICSSSIFISCKAPTLRMISLFIVMTPSSRLRQNCKSGLPFLRSNTSVVYPPISTTNIISVLRSFPAYGTTAAYA